METTYGEYVRQRRVELKITLRSFAEQIGIYPSYVSSMETGDKPAPSDEVLKKIASVLCLSTAQERELYDLAAQTRTTNKIPLDITETLLGNSKVKVALRVAKDFDATDEEWEDFMRRLREKHEGG